jgi:anaerobic ribonucleoside-triphosphate reductase activating protein
MNYAAVKFSDIANGPGVRTSLFVSGCRVHCPGCFNGTAWDFEAGEPFTDTVALKVWKSLEPPWVRGLTVLGGEPFEPENQEALLPFLSETRERFPAKDVWAFSGYLYDRDLVPASGRRHTEHTDRLLACLDVLVDGPYLDAEHDITLRFRGSANQRLIDVPASLRAGRVVPWHDQAVYETHTM